MSPNDDIIILELSKLAARALRMLGPVGPETREQACLLAGQAWALLHESYPDAAERMNGVLHYLTGPRFAEAARGTETEVETGADPDSDAGAGKPPTTETVETTKSRGAGQTAGHPWLPPPPTLQSEDAVAAYFEKVKAMAKAGGDFDMEVRHLIPADRHTLIIDVFDTLEPGQAFVLINDHDPKPLYYQFAFEYADRFTWDPIEEGSEVWRVKIGRR